MTKKAKRRPAKRKPVRCQTKPKPRPKAKRRSRASAADPFEAVEARRRRRAKKKATCRRKKKRRPKKRPVARKPVVVAPAPPAIATPPPPAAPRPADPPAPAPRLDSPVAKYTGPFGVLEAERLLWRAGFGPSPGHAEALAALGMERAVMALTRSGGAPSFTGPEPTVGGQPLQPTDAFGHDHLLWLDRMVRTDQPFVERMALIWHDWFATSDDDVGSPALMLGQYETFRAHGRGSFEDLVRRVTIDPAMILYLNQDENRRGRINENYARELMELFTLGADRGAYSETDVRELGRALSGWTRSYTPELGYHSFRFDPARHDTGTKTVFGQTGTFGWEDAYRMCVGHPLHASFFVEKLWSYFIPTPPSDSDRQALQDFYVRGGRQVVPVVEAILAHPALHSGPRMVKPPAVFTAGLLRAMGRGIETNEWVSLCLGAGQRLFRPPDVSGWDDERWLDTSTIRGRWLLVRRALDGRHLTGTATTSYSDTETPEEAVGAAAAFWRNPPLTPEARATLVSFAATCLPATMTPTQRRTLRAMRQNALRHLVYASPDLQAG